MNLPSVENSESFLAAMLHLSNIPILITDARLPDNPIVLVNPAFEQATGYSAHEVVGRNCRFLQNDDRQQPGRAAVSNAVRTGMPCEALFRNYRKDGKLFWTCLYVFPITGDSGEITHHVGIQHDVTAETELRLMLEEKQIFVDTSPDVYIRIAADLKIVQANGACEAISGWTAAELVGKSAAMLISIDRLDEAREKIKALLLQEKPSRFSAGYLNKAGARITIEWSAVRTQEQDGVLLVGRDITDTHAAQRQAEQANARVNSVLNSITEGCLSLNPAWTVIHVNRQAGKWLNKRPEDLINKNFWDELPETVRDSFYEIYHQVMHSRKFDKRDVFYAPVGKWLEVRVYPSESGVTIFFLDISERKKQELALLYSATHDALTGLPNRNVCLETLTHRLDANFLAGEDVAAIFIDLDRFKEINDAFGHAAGDQALVQIGQRLLAFSSDTCYPARISGDEFVVIMSGGDEMHAKTLALQILDSIAAPIQLNGSDVTIGASIGIALTRGATVTADDLINQADTAMYLSKSNGRHSLTVFNSNVDKWNLRRRRLRQDMLQALHKGEFVLYYQPQVSLQDNTVFGTEALIRWRHPEFGLLSPAAFIEIAEESPLIIEMGAWVFDEACRQLRQWQDLGYSLKMSINVSVRQLASRDMPEMMTQTIKRHGVAAHCVMLEITESMLAQDFDSIWQVLEGLKQRGFRIALDDFGTGYSNLSYISRLPVTAIKIDRSFVTGLISDKGALPLINAIVALAKSLDLTVICEGVETAEQRTLLESTQCDSIQGYLISRPLPAEDFFNGFLNSEKVSLGRNPAE